jgi:hypothetical protein
MKISKLKYVFAFVLLVAISVVSTNVQAVQMPNNGQIKLSTIVASQLAEIVGGDTSDTITVNNKVTSFNTSYYPTVLGTTMSPAQFYTLVDKTSGLSFKAYSLTVGTVTEQDAEYVKTGTYANTRVGLGLAFGLSYLSADQLANQSALDNYSNAYSYATQVYTWLANAGALGTASEDAIVSTMGGSELDRYRYIRNSVEQSLLKPSYTYNSESEAKAQPIEMGWSETNQRYEVTVQDTNALDTMALVNLAIQSENISYSKNGNYITFYSTEQIGSASNPATVKVIKSINGGRYAAEVVNLKDGSNSFAYLSGAAYNNDVYYVSFYTNALRVKVVKTLNSSYENSNTGDASVKGARYGVYSDAACTQLVQELVTDANGEAVTNPVEYKDYYVKELSASEGCKINSNVVKASANQAKVESNGQRVVTVQSGEDVIYGGFRMIVSTSPDLSGNTTKVPSVGSEITLTLDSDPSQVYVKTVDENGYVDFTNIPYGHYTCTETKRPNVSGAEKVDLMDPMSIFINSEETFIYSKIVNTEVAQRYVKIIKTDAESGNLVTATATTYKVVNSKGETVVQKTMYPVEKELNEYVTEDDKGVVYGYVVLPEKLPADTYKVYEVTAPYGYYNQSAATGKPIATFTVEPNSTDDYDRTQIVEVNTQNKVQKANLTLSVKGNVLTGTNTQSAYGQTGVERPAYTTQAIQGATYDVVANEDIVTGDGVVHYKAGDVVYSGTTDANGKITTKLYIGSYTIKMTSAPEGYELDTTERTVEVTYQDQKVEEYDLPVENYTLTRQEYDLDVTKVFSGLNFYKQGETDKVESIDSDAFADVVVGIYAAEDIKNVYGTVVIAKDTLVDVVIFDKDGKGTFASEYPMGKFYAKEIATNENYALSNEKYEFEAKPTNNTDARFEVSVGEIVNEALRVTQFKLTKIEEVIYEEENTGVVARLASFAEGILNGLLSNVEKTTDVTRLQDAKYAVYYLDEDGKYYALLEKVGDDFVEVVRTTDENGEFVIEGLPFGSYAVKEVEAPRYYDLNESSYGFDLTQTSKEQELVLQDVRTKVDVNIAVVDEDGNKLEKAVVQLVDPETNEVAYEAETDEDGIASFEQIRAGRYIRQVVSLDDKYVVPGVKELYLEEDSDLVETVKVKFITGKILINKTDDETGEVVPDCLFRVTNEAGEVVAEERTDDNGQLLIAGLRYGVYYVEEVEAAEGYEKSDLVFEVTITEDGHTYVVDFTNVPTGDIAVALYAIIALVSVAAITVSVKKLRKN